MRLLGKDMSPCTQGKAAWALANMAEAEENKLRIASFPGALEGLVRLLSVEEFNQSLHSTHHNRNERLASARALSNLNAAWALASLSDCKDLKVNMEVSRFRVPFEIISNAQLSHDSLRTEFIDEFL